MRVVVSWWFLQGQSQNTWGWQGLALSGDSLTLTMREVWTMMGLFWGLSNIHYNHCNIHPKVEELVLFCPNLQMFYQFHGLLQSRECIVNSKSRNLEVEKTIWIFWYIWYLIRQYPFEQSVRTKTWAEF